MTTPSGFWGPPSAGVPLNDPAPHEVDDIDLDDDERFDRDLADEENGCTDPQCEGC